VAEKAERRKDEIVTGLTDARACILAAVAALPAEMRDEAFLGVWSVKDLLAHLVGWDYTNIEAAAEIQAAKLPSFYQHRDRDWSSYNASLIARYRTENWVEMVSAVESSHRLLIDYLGSVPPQEFCRDRGIRSGRYKVTIDRLLAVEVKDEWEHCWQIREYVERGARD
jgi:hypothetical protein